MLIRTKQLAKIVNARQKKSAIISRKTDHFGLDFIEEDAAIVIEIKSLMAKDRQVKK